jgi:NADH-quinone oxidoreductase subunit N
MINVTALDFVPAFPEIFLSVAGMFLLLFGAVKGNRATNFICWMTMASFIITAVLIMQLDWDRSISLNGMFVMDSFAGFMKLLILFALTVTMAISISYIYQEEIIKFEYPVLLLFSGIGMLLMVSAHNLLSMYVGLELQALCLYILAAIRRDHIKSAEAGIKYFVLGALASGMLLYGISLVYGFTGSISFETIGDVITNLESPSIAITIGLVFILTGMAFKISAVPFHMWTPDVYQGSPTSVTAFFSIVPKIAAFGLLMRLLYEPFGASIWEWQQIIWFLSAASMILASFAAIAQKNIKRLMAYSTIGNIGYALIGVIAGSSIGAGATIVYMTIYMVMTAGVFGIILLMRRNNVEVDNLSDLAGLSRNSPMIAYGMAILMFSMSGIPPLAGFIGKFMIFEAAIAEGFYILAIIGVLSSVVAAFYYLRIIKIMFFDEAADPFDSDIAFLNRAVMLVSILFVLFFIVAPDTLVSASRNAASILFVG